MKLKKIEENYFEFFRKGIQHLAFIKKNNELKSNINININFINSILNYCNQFNELNLSTLLKIDIDKDTDTDSNNDTKLKEIDTGYNFNFIYNLEDLTKNNILNINELITKLKGTNIKLYKNCIKNIFKFLKIKRKEIHIQISSITNSLKQTKILILINIQLKEEKRLKIISDIKYYSIIEKNLFILFNTIIV
jgi:hypothetical protein